MRTILLPAALGLSLLAPAQKTDPKHTNYYKVPPPIETPEMLVEFKDPVAQMAMCKVRVQFTNKTPDYLLINASEIKFTIAGNSYSPKDRDFLIKPNDNISRTLEVTGSDLHADAFTLDFGGLSRVPRAGKAATLDDFDLPASQNTVGSGPFQLNLLNLEKTTAKTVAKFKVTYNGDKIALIDPSQVAVKIESGQQFANAASKSKEIMLSRGEEDTFNVIAEIPGKIVDMQFANMKLVWNKAFVETSAVPFRAGGASFALDPGLTQGKN